MADKETEKTMDDLKSFPRLAEQEDSNSVNESQTAETFDASGETKNLLQSKITAFLQRVHNKRNSRNDILLQKLELLGLTLRFLKILQSV